ncbi:hypothetical protein SAMN05216337_1017120 [Bradyrhizobium brasilense]|uniref:Terminase large subunit gp17-like C-terminal domain-containing protein n=1 Tax=Bradyrhizobium brasilense TaxID=1419277 RepID=A0A1G6YWB1_9BRAD|nr:hypothetical protein [Bradyrhizobium brasilense]SDD94628.1 hypothetical protein SAMN05216337_1017120 [Bradyrhizobium brasilense]
MNIDSSVASRLAHWREKPSDMVRELFGVEPDKWQTKALDLFPKSPRMAMKACKGPGKTTVLAWIAWNFLLTRPHPNIAATSISGANLADGLWKEMAKWRNRSPFLQSQFEWTKSRIFAKDHPETWFMSARSYRQDADSEQQANTLAGFHADHILFLIDESGAAPDALMPTAEAAFAGCIEAHIVQAGNPTHLAGPLYRACTIARRLWVVIEITGDPDDPERSPRIPVEYAKEQIEQYGRDHPYVMVNILGKFPPSSMNVLIGPDEVREAMKRVYRANDIAAAAKVIGVDVARFGDDVSVLFPRQGLQAFKPKRHRNIDGVQGAGQVARLWNDWAADAAFVDNTGGYGSSWIDQLLVLGKTPIPVEYAGQAHNPSRYYNKRAEMYFDAVDWIKRGGALPSEEHPGMSELLAALTQTTYTFKGDRFLLEPKDMVKAKLGYSPDDADAFVTTFAEPVTPKPTQRAISRQARADYDPFANSVLHDVVQQSMGSYDAFGGQ